jgi:hypothetical protein
MGVARWIENRPGSLCCLYRLASIADLGGAKQWNLHKIKVTQLSGVDRHITAIPHVIQRQALTLGLAMAGVKPAMRGTWDQIVIAELFSY